MEALVERDVLPWPLAQEDQLKPFVSVALLGQILAKRICIEL